MDIQRNSKKGESEILIKAVKKTLEEAFESGGKRPLRLIVGVSGGADSVTLLHSLRSLTFHHPHIFAGYREEVGPTPESALIAVHCNFHLRGEESNRDMMFAEQLCDELNVPLLTTHFDVEDYRRHHPGTSIEMACRELRYDFFRKVMADKKASRIAVAHNADDNIETMFLNLFRGSSLTGLKGMLPDNGEIIRPLLSVGRKEILEYIAENNLLYITDSSNADSTYRRNFIRNELLPLVESRWPGVKKTITRTLTRLREEQEMSQSSADRLLTDKERLLSYDTIKGVASPSWLIGKWVERHGGSAFIADDIIRSLASDKAESGQHWVLPEGKILREREGLKYVPGKDKAQDIPDRRVKMEEVEITEQLFAKIRQSGLEEVWLPGRLTDYNLRHPQIGDRIAPLGMKGTKLVSKLMKDAKLDAISKTEVIIAERKDTKEIVWVGGLCRSRSYLLTPSTLTASHFSIQQQES